MFARHIEALLSAFEAGKTSRRDVIAAVGALITGAVAAERAAATASTGAPGGGNADTPTFTAVGLNHIALDVTNVNRSRDWYVRHLGMTVTRQSEDNCFLDCGPHFVALFKSATAGMNHYCYSINGYSAGEAVKTLEAAGLKPTRRENRVYFPDPDGLTVQVAEAPH